MLLFIIQLLWEKLMLFFTMLCGVNSCGANLCAVLISHVQEVLVWICLQTCTKLFEEMKSSCTIQSESCLCILAKQRWS